jgi:hypothetical protein
VVVIKCAIWLFFPSLDRELDSEPVKASHRHPLIRVVICFELPYHISKLVLGENGDPGVVLGLDQSMRCYDLLAFFFEGHGRIWEICGCHENRHIALIRGVTPRHSWRWDSTEIDQIEMFVLLVCQERLRERRQGGEVGV